MMYVLFWGVYPQWTKQFSSDEDAVAAAHGYANQMEASISEFKLIKNVSIPL